MTARSLGAVNELWDATVRAVNELESWAFPSFPRRGGRDPKERPGWLCVPDKNHPGCASQGTGLFLGGAPPPLLGKEGNALDSNSFTAPTVAFPYFIHSSYDCPVLLQSVFQQIPDVFNGFIRRRIGFQHRGIARIVPLLWKYRRHTISPNLFHCCQDADFVVNKNVMLCRVMMLDIIAHLLFMNIDQDTSLHRRPKARAFDFSWLKYSIAIGKDHRPAHGVQMSNDVQSLRIEPIREWIIHKKRGHPEKTRIMQPLETITLQSTEKIGISEFGAQLLQNIPVSFACFMAEDVIEVIAKILFDAVIVQERVVHIEKEDTGAIGSHVASLTALPDE